MQCTNDVPRKHVPLTTVTVKKLIIKNYDCYFRIFALLIRYIKRKRRSMLSSVNCLTLRVHLSILPHTRPNIYKYTENKSGVLIFSTTSSKTFLTLTAERCIIKHVHKSVRYTCHMLIKF